MRNTYLDAPIHTRRYPMQVPTRVLAVLVAGLLAAGLRPASAQRPDSAAWAALAAASAEDHRHMMAHLGIDSLRTGPSGNPQAPNAANSDEARVPPYSLPDPLVLHDGARVTTADQWWTTRRPEIVEDFDREVYGRMPQDVPDVRWEIESTARETEGGHAVIVKRLVGRADNSAHPGIEVNLEMTLTTPADAESPVPVIIHLGWRWPAGMRPPVPSSAAVAGTWQQQLLDEGWGYAVLIPTSYQADHGAGLTQGVIGLANRGERRQPEDWGALRAWAWGVSRAIDYLEADPDADAERVGIEGLSRYGKAALVAMAYEPRLAIGFIGSSGAGGAKILRRDFGEQVENLASSGEYHWFAGEFIKYAGPLTVRELPVDAHHLIALAAPRPVFISVGSPDVEGHWVDARGMFLAAVHAGAIYRLLGEKGLSSEAYPQQGVMLGEGSVAFRQHEGGHTTGPNWPYFIEFARRYFVKEESQ